MFLSSIRCSFPPVAGTVWFELSRCLGQAFVSVEYRLKNKGGNINTAGRF